MSKRAAEIERRRELAATVEAREQIIRPKKKRGGDELLVLTNTSTTCKTATQGRRTELVKPGGQAIVSERELDGLRKGSGEHDRAFQKMEKFNPNNPQHRDLMRRHKGE